MINRTVQPLMGPASYKTYQVKMPLSTHWVTATCDEVDCAHYRGGWRVRVEGLTPELIHTIKTSGRSYQKMTVSEGETWLIFSAGQPCFRASTHKVPAERPGLYIVRGGDFRGNPRGDRRVHKNGQEWAEDFSEHLDKIQNEIKKG